MKTNNFILLLLISIFILSCSKREDVIYDGVYSDNPTLIKFSKKVYDMPVNIDSSVNTDITIQSSSIADFDRTYNLVVNDANSTASMNNYSLPSTVTIPANSYSGTLTINITDDIALTTMPETVEFSINNLSSSESTNGPVTLNLFQVCAIPDDFFIGSYMLEQTSSFVDGPSLSDGEIVEVSGTGISRMFSTQNYPNYCSPYMDFSFKLVCNEIIVDTMDTLCRCSDGTDWFTAASIPATYDLNNGDATMYVTFTDDTQNDCGTPAQTTYKLIKQ